MHSRHTSATTKASAVLATVTGTLATAISNRDRVRALGLLLAIFGALAWVNSRLTDHQRFLLAREPRYSELLRYATAIRTENAPGRDGHLERADYTDPTTTIQRREGDIGQIRHECSGITDPVRPVE